jgi:L,D-peptidoglycan transpeptidase YkuD (ErfK/YbiS/YcfS/YnhG family)
MRSRSAASSRTPLGAISRSCRGSAIFLHCAHPGFKPTEGCVALARDALIALVEMLRPGDVLEIAP